MLSRCLLSLALASTVRSQCFDLTSTHLYQVNGRFQEWWDKPIWNAKPGEGNFHVDDSGPAHFSTDLALFAVGEVRKTEKGWIPFRKSRVHEVWCDETPERSAGLCYAPPYTIPPPSAHRIGRWELNLETWSLDRNGLLRYTHQTRGESPFDHTYTLGPNIFEAVLDLNTGAYSALNQGHAGGMYKRRIPEGVEMRRKETGSAKAKLQPVTCSATLQKVGLRSDGVVADEAMNPIPFCVVKVKSEPTGGFEFVQNPLNLTSPQGCVAVHEGPMPRELRLAQRPSEVHEK